MLYDRSNTKESHDKQIVYIIWYQDASLHRLEQIEQLVNSKFPNRVHIVLPFGTTVISLEKEKAILRLNLFGYILILRKEKNHGK